MGNTPYMGMGTMVPTHKEKNLSLPHKGAAVIVPELDVHTSEIESIKI